MFVPSTTLPPIVYGADPAEYHKQPAKRGTVDFVMSRSELRRFSACPSKWLRGIPEEKTDAMDWGSMLDVLVLTPDKFDSTFAIYPDTYQPEKGDPKLWSNNATYCREWRLIQEKDGRRCVWKEDAEKAKAAAKSLLESEHIAEYLSASHTQVQINVMWQDLKTGIVIPFKAMVDAVPKSGDSLADLKTTKDALYKPWIRAMDSGKYAYQAACYLMAFNAATGEKRREFIHLIIENSEPFESTYRPVHEDWIWTSPKAQRPRVEADLALYCEALATGKWRGLDHAPSYPEAYMDRDE